MNSVRRPSLLWPLLLIGLGSLLLLQNFGLLPAGSWAALLELWPVLLILLGLDILFVRRSSGSAALILLLGALIVAGALTWAALRASQLPPGTTQSIIQSGRGAETASVEIDFDAGELHLSAMGASDYLMEGQVQNAAGESLRQTYSVRGDEGHLTLSQEHSALLVPFLARTTPARWNIRLAPSMTLTLDVSTGAGVTTLDLSGLNLTTLELSSGVGQTSVTFPASGSVVATVRAGVGDVTLTIPGELPARITLNSGLTGVNIPSRFARAGRVYTTPGFSTTGDYLDLEVAAGVGNVVVK